MDNNYMHYEVYSYWDDIMPSCLDYLQTGCHKIVREY